MEQALISAYLGLASLYHFFDNVRICKANINWLVPSLRVMSWSTSRVGGKLMGSVKISENSCNISYMLG